MKGVYDFWDQIAAENPHLPQWHGTQEEYDRLAEVHPDTIYFIGEPAPTRLEKIFDRVVDFIDDAALLILRVSIVAFPIAGIWVLLQYLGSR